MLYKYEMNLFYFLCNILIYSTSFALSFLFSGFFRNDLTVQEIEEEEEEERKMIQHLDELNFEYKYLDEYEELKKIHENKMQYTINTETNVESNVETNTESNATQDKQTLDEKALIEVENDLDKDKFKNLKETTLEIPFLKVKIIMYYENDTFYYYCNTDVVYKYLNVVCRKFVIENDVPELYVEKTESYEVKTEGVSSALFVTKSDSVLLEKKMNKFIRVGSIYDYDLKHIKKNIKEINVMDFLSSR